MNDLYAIVPASAIILIIGLRKILAPVQFNQEIFGEIHPDEVNNSASMRMMIGAGLIKLPKMRGTTGEIRHLSTYDAPISL